MTHTDILLAFVMTGLTLLAGKAMRKLFPFLANLFLPSAVLGGGLALLLGPQVLGRGVERYWPTVDWLTSGIIPESTLMVWRGLPGLLISVVFAALLMGRPLPGIREIWRRAGSQVAFGQSIAWGQYVVGITLGMMVLTPYFGLPPMAGALIEIAFEGGHGTAAGMAETFASLGFEEGADLALALATVGIVSGVIAGTIMINRAARRGWIPPSQPNQLTTDPSMVDRDEQAYALDVLRKEQEQALKPTDPLSVHLALVGLAIGLGWLLRHGLVFLENMTWARDGGPVIFGYLPLFPLAMLGGVGIQVVLDRTGLGEHVSHRMMGRISGTALDFTIVAALATLSLSAIQAYWAPFLLLALTGLAWNLFAMIVLAPRMLPQDWFERGICDFGQSTGVTVTGLLLLRMADPSNRSGTLESFGYKQLLFEPIVGGGLFTAASVPLIVQLGPGLVLTFTAGLMVFWILLGWWLFGRKGGTHR